jgi:hypothetical protein
VTPAGLLLVFLLPTEPPTPPPPDTETQAANVIFAEALGNGLLYSVNYERLFHEWNVGLRAGGSFFTYAVSKYGKAGNLTIVSFPMVASYYFTWGTHSLQLGLGATLLHTQVATDSQGLEYGGERAGTALAPTGVVGYRYLPRKSGVSFGIGFTPLLRASKFLPWGGATIGYAF